MGQKSNSDEIEIDLRQMILALRSKLMIIIAISLLGAVLGFTVSKFGISPEYMSTSKLYIVNRQNDGVTTYTDIQTSTQLIKDYKVLVTSTPVLEQVISNLKLDRSAAALAGQITVSIESDSRVLEIGVIDKDQYKCKTIVDEIADVSAQQITKVMQIEGVNIIQYGEYPSGQISPNIKKYTLIGLLVGMVLTCAIIIIRFLLNDSIKDSDDIEKYLGISTLALIPISESSRESGKKKKKRIVR